MGPRVGPSSLPFPGGSQPGCPGRLPQPSRGSGAPGRALPSSRLPFPDGPRPWCPSGPGVWGGFPGRSGAQGPRVGPSHPPGCRSPMGPGPGVRRARVSGEASPAALGLRGPGSGPPILQAALPRWAPALVSVGPGCLGRLPRPLRDSGAPGRALPSSRLPFPDGPRPGCPAGPPRPPRPLRVVRGPGSGPPILQPALRRWAPARVSGGPGEASPAAPGGQGPWVGPSSLPCPDGPRPGCPGWPWGQGPWGGPSQPALPRWAPAGPPGTPSAPWAPRAKAECVQMATLRARPSGLTENPGHLVALRAGLLWRVQMAGLPRKSR
ncbi:hypothetical protein NDU88_004122 [Pleurodeles waltl]|uniref:Basic proline-rich protein-like n=1 Tax=Pleurodeles waltl TaxID=8319 RepID=A0AAV7V4D7_PLEWA|nr:hypothetical protein NDU88_004122 [Pleurodeles waltl]